jgi:RNA polymerase sigma-70 factor, ECF subfamily
MTVDEARWVEAARGGDARAFRRLVELHANTLFRACSRITGDAALAEDAVQEALFNAFRHLRNFDGRSAFSTWLHRIAINAALQQMRKRRHVEAPLPGLDDDAEATLDTADPAPGPDRHASSAEIQRQVERELARMTPLERSAFVLRHHEDRSLEEIAAELSINISGCKQAIFRAVRKLRSALEPPGETS